MWIKRLSTHNWRAFPGENSIEFSVDRKKPITIIHAENEFGKSSLTAAMRWAMHGTLPPSISADVIDSNTKGPAKVELIIESDIEGDLYDYQIVRTINSKGETDLTMQRDTGSGWVPIERSQRKFIELLMPKELSDIFFFNGENLQKSFIETEDASKSMRDSVLTVTGIKSATHTIYYLEQYLKDLIQNKERMENRNITNKSSQTQLQKLDKDIKQLEKELKEAKEEKQEIKQVIKNLNKELVKNGEEEVKKATKDRRRALEEITKRRNELQTKEDEKLDLIQKYSFIILTNQIKFPLIKKDKENKNPFDLSISPTKTGNKMLENIKLHDHCLCGRPVNHSEECLASLESFYIQGKKLGEISQKQIDIENKFVNRKSDIDKFIKEKGKIDHALKTARSSITQQNDILTETGSILDNVNEAEIKSLGDDLKVAEKRESDLEELIEGTNLPGLIDRLANKREARKLLKKKNTDLIEDEEIKELELKITFVEKQKKFLKFQQDKLERSTKKKLEEELNNLAEMYSKTGSRFKYVGDSYIPLFLKEGKEKEDQPSTGGAALKSIFYGAALVKVAQEREKEKSPIIDPGCPSTWVCDAPFASLDPGNIESCAKIVMGYERQLITFVNSDDYHTGFDEELKKNKKLGKRYLIKKHIVGSPATNVSTKIKINNKIYETIKKSKKGYDWSEIIKI
mgnify:CR=1 FL=1